MISRSDKTLTLKVIKSFPNFGHGIGLVGLDLQARVNKFLKKMGFARIMMSQKTIQCWTIETIQGLDLLFLFLKKEKKQKKKKKTTESFCSKD